LKIGHSPKPETWHFVQESFSEQETEQVIPRLQSDPSCSVKNMKMYCSSSYFALLFESNLNGRCAIAVVFRIEAS